MASVKNKEKFSCIANCLPVKSKLLARVTGKEKNINNKSTIPLTIDGVELEENKLENTKNWLQNLSTVASYDPCSILQDPDSSGIEITDIKNVDKKLLDADTSSDDSICAAKKQYYDESTLEESQLTVTKEDRYADGRSASSCIPVDDEITFHKNYYNDNGIQGRGHQYSSNYGGKEKIHYGDTSKNHPEYTQDSKRRTRPQGRHNNTPEQQTMGDTSSMASSCISLSTELVILDMNVTKSLGITIVGHNSAAPNVPGGSDCGIFVGCVKKGGAAEASGRVEPGDLILEVNGIDLERMSNEQALAVLRGEIAKGGFVRLLLAKYWDLDTSSISSSKENASARIHQSYRGNPLYHEEKYGTLNSCQRFPHGNIDYSNKNMEYPHRNMDYHSNADFHRKLPFQEMLPPPSCNYAHSRISSYGYSEKLGPRTTSVYSGRDFGPRSIPEGAFPGVELVEWVQSKPGYESKRAAKDYAQSMLDGGYIKALSDSTKFDVRGWYTFAKTNVSKGGF